MLTDVKTLLLKLLFGRWRSAASLEPGYTIVLLSPMDMPFLLRFALEGIRMIETDHCREILVVPDGWGKDGGAALRSVAASADDPRIRVVRLRPHDYWIIRSMRPPGSAATHWAGVVNGTHEIRTQHAFLHDADAFFLDGSSLERQYRECVDRDMYTLGVTARLDPFFKRIGYQIPGTWQLMYSVEWARARPPYELKGRRLMTPHGENLFDSMLARQYQDYPSGRVGVMADGPRYVHFNGTIFSYRIFRDRAGKSVRDEFFRVLLLALLEDAMPSADGRRAVPEVSELSRGLRDAGNFVRYDGEEAARQYPIFRAQVEEMCRCPIFQGQRAAGIRAKLEPFDAFFASRPAVAPVEQVMRTHGIGE